MLFNGPGGWKIEPGWWKREPKDFGEQLQWCGICGGALFHKGRLSSEGIDDVSPTLYKKLQAIGSPKLHKGKVVILKDMEYKSGSDMSDSSNRYLSNHLERISPNNSQLYPKNIDVIQVPKDYTFGNDFIRKVKNTHMEWICLCFENETVSEEYMKRLKNVVLNPGVLYQIDEQNNKGILFHLSARALKKAGHDGISHCTNLSTFKNLWNAEDQIVLAHDFDVFQNPDVDEWESFVKTLSLDPQQKQAVEQCLHKIKSDYKKVD